LSAAIKAEPEAIAEAKPCLAVEDRTEVLARRGRLEERAVGVHAPERVRVEGRLAAHDRDGERALFRLAAPGDDAIPAADPGEGSVDHDARAGRRRRHARAVLAHDAPI